MTAEYIPYLTVAAAWAVPVLTEMAKRRFGAQAELRAAQHEKHAEIMAELTAARAEMKELRARAIAAEDRTIAAEEKIVGLLQDIAGKARLITTLTDLFPKPDAPPALYRPPGTEEKTP